MTRTPRSWFFALALLSLAAGCDSERIKRGVQAGPATAGERFRWIEENVLKPKCLDCHGGAKTLGHVDVSSYEILLRDRLVVAGQPEASRLYRSVLPPAGKMPKGGAPLSEMELRVLSEWIRDGALKSGEAPPPPPPPPPPKPEPTFKYISRYILEARCIACHPGPKSKLDLTSYKKIMEAPEVVVPESPEDSTLFTKSDNGKMPPPPEAKLDDAQLKAIYDWILKGAPEN